MIKDVVIVAGGQGLRMGADLPKQFIPLAGKPILMYTIERFYKFDHSMNIILILPDSQIDFWRSLCDKHQFSVKHNIARGGSERFFSVKNGLECCRKGGLIAVHDGVRPFVSNDTLTRCFYTAEKLGNAIPTIPIADSIREINVRGSMPIDRSKLCAVQTPQVFLANDLFSAYNLPFSSEFTDDASVVEANGGVINLVEGNRENIKITTPVDLVFGEAIITAQLI